MDSIISQRYDSFMLATENEVAILNRVIQPEAGDIPPQAARALLAWRFSDSDHARMDELSAKARAGSLTEPETQELDNYLHIGFLLGTMQAKARRVLPAESTLAPQ